MSALSRGIETQHETPSPGPKERPTKRAAVGGSNLLQNCALGGELKSRAESSIDCSIEKNLMRILKHICLTVAQLAKQTRAFPAAIVRGFRHSRQQAAWKEAEAERLDRIRHPSKYLGK